VLKMFKRVILLTGMPRSGTSWLSQIFDSSPSVRFRLSPLFSYEFKNALNEESSYDEWYKILKGAYESENDFMNQSYRRKAGEYPVFDRKEQYPSILVIKDTRFHNLTYSMLELIKNLKVVVIVRHPCGAIHSWLTAPKEFPSGADPLKEWRTGSCRKNGYGEYWGFSDWLKVTRQHVQLEKIFSAQVIIQQYEDLVLDAIGESKKLFKFCEIDFSQETENFIKISQQENRNSEYAVFKAPHVTNRWKKELQTEIKNSIFSELENSDLQRFLK